MGTHEHERERASTEARTSLEWLTEPEPRKAGENRQEEREAQDSSAAAPRPESPRSEPDWISTGPRERRRTGRKRTVFQPPNPAALPVRGLWNQASPAEQQEAHRLCVAVLELWLGKKAKEDLCDELGVKPLRVWQLSQLALSGMMAGLLRQPRMPRGRPPAYQGPPQNDPRVLKRRIAELEGQLSRTEDLVRVLRTAPWASPDPAEGAEMKGKRKRRRKAHARHKAKPERRQRAEEEAARLRREDASGGSVRASEGESGSSCEAG